MPSSLQAYRIFIASPGGLEQFRKCFRRTIDQYNEADAIRRGVYFIAVGWEDTLGGMGRPQRLINNELSECDYCVVVLKDRWGSPADTTAESDTGTQEEFKLAIQLKDDPEQPMSEVVVFFAAVEPDRMSDPGPQLEKVLEFRSELEASKQHLFRQVEDADDFADILRRYLASWIRDHEQANEAVGADAAGPVSLEIPEGQPLPAAPEGAPMPAANEKADAAEVPTDPISQSDTLIAEGRYTEAETLLSAVIARGHDPGAQLAYGRLLARLHRRRQAVAALSEAMRIGQAAGEAGVAAEAAEELAKISDELGQTSEFRSYAASAFKLYAEAGDQVGAARTLILQGESLRMDGSFEDAIATYRKAIDLAEAARDLLVEANGWLGLSEVYRDAGKLDDAQESLKRSSVARREAGVPETGDTHAALGAVLEAIGDFDRAEEEYRISTDLFRQENNRLGMADAADHIGQICLRRGDLDGAEDAFQHSAALFEAVQNVEGATDAYLSLGRTQLQRADHEAAIRSLRSAMALVQQRQGEAARSAQAEITALLDGAYEQATAKPTG